MWRPASDAAPGKPGLARSSIVCELAKHTDTAQHCGIAREFPGPLGGAVWAEWLDGREPHFPAREDCAGRVSFPDGPDDVCALFADHPEPCMSALSSVYRESPARLPRILDVLGVLGHGDRHEPAAVQATAEEAVLLVWDELTARDAWAPMADWNHAAMYRLLSWAHSRESSPDLLSALSGGLADFARLCTTPSEYACRRGEDAAAMLTCIRDLPQPWQVTVLGGQRKPKCRESSYYDPDPRPSTPRRGLAEALADATERAGRNEDPPRPHPNYSRSDWDLEEDCRLGATALERLSGLPHG
ncbi:hypothetical protein ACIHCQ_41840 [Streptomyces sp. NPDC052236]|uniref:hypothetical protein n=1 Tax=Streptomyces sp. NPDC052236 TaxID=3365686 RepID=UPI0037D35715